MEDKQPIIVRMVGPARPLLNRTGSPLHSIYHRRFDELPQFPHVSEEDEQLQQQRANRPDVAQRRSYIVYRRDISETWNYNLNKQEPLSGQPLPPAQQQVLRFESNFESGNLKQAEKIWAEQEYNLLMQRDINTYGYTQWFFFKVSDAQRGRQYKFNLTNFYKKSSLFQKGMKVMVYSLKEQQNTRRGWHRDCTDIHYFRNGTVEEVGNGRLKQYCTLSFSYTFRHEDDEVFFAYNYPYTYTQLNSYLDRLEGPQKSIMYRAVLTRTLAGNRVQILTITNFINNRQKKGIFITGRTHPGQTVSSYIVKGVIDFLTSDDQSAFQLRDNFVFKIVPMVNPDGVIHGNYRSNLSGSDLNRKWEAPSKRLHPEIYYLKKNILEFAQRTPILMFCDMHGHSGKKNAFIYGCADKSNPFKTREFPFLVSKASKSFSFEDCTFGIKNDKKGTARAVLWKKLAIPNIFTLETSFCGPAQPEVHFGYRHFEEIGKRFCETLLIHFQDQIRSPEVSCYSKPFSELRQNRRSDILNELYKDQRYVTMGDDNGESDSQQSIDEISEKDILRLEKGILPKERILTKQQRATEPMPEKSPSISRTRRVMIERSSVPKPRMAQSPDHRTDIDSTSRNLYRKSEKTSKLPVMYLQPKMFTIVDPDPKLGQWNFNNYQEQLTHNMTHSTITTATTNLHYKSYSFANRRSLKLSSPRNKAAAQNQDRSYTIFNDSKFQDCAKPSRRVKTETIEQQRLTSIDFEIRLRAARNSRPRR